MESGHSVTLGRGASGDMAISADLFQQRPGLNLPRPPLADAHVSKRQLELRATDDGIAYRNIGRCGLFANGASATAGLAKLGDTLYLEGASLWLVVNRPPVLVELTWVPLPGSAAFGKADRSGIIGESPAIWALRDQIGFVAGKQSHVLVVGDEGTGKRLVAEGIHGLSVRAGYPLITDPLDDFHDGSTLYVDLDDVGDDVFTHLRRVLVSGKDLRIIGSTREPGALPADLVSSLELQVRAPGLEDRPEDIPLLISHLLGSGFADVDPGMVDALLRHSYTRHLGELEDLIGSTT